MNLVYVGKIVNTHGLKGELRILSTFSYKEKIFVPGFKTAINKHAKISGDSLNKINNKFISFIIIGSLS